MRKEKPRIKEEYNEQRENEKEYSRIVQESVIWKMEKRKFLTWRKVKGGNS